MGPSGVAALRAVLPKDCKVYAVGGAGSDNFADWLKVGTTGFGIGTALFTPDLTRDDIRDRARAIVASYDQAAAKI
jgi:2-dehydro-3-deoxyphosphogalactonate aldolase